MAKPTVMLFVLLTGVVPRNHLLDRDSDPQQEGEILRIVPSSQCFIL